MNYIVLHDSSQLIVKVITSPSPPTPDNGYSFYEASIIVLNHYYKLHKKAIAKAYLDKYRRELPQAVYSLKYPPP